MNKSLRSFALIAAFFSSASAMADLYYVKCMSGPQVVFEGLMDSNSQNIKEAAGKGFTISGEKKASLQRRFHVHSKQKDKFGMSKAFKACKSQSLILLGEISSQTQLYCQAGEITTLGKKTGLNSSGVLSALHVDPNCIQIVSGKEFQEVLRKK